MFEVMILKDKAWLLLGKDIGKVITLIRRNNLKPVRLYTSDPGRFLHVGLWLRTGETQGITSKPATRRMVELYNILRGWSLQAHGSERAKSLAKFLVDDRGAEYHRIATQQVGRITKFIYGLHMTCITEPKSTCTNCIFCLLDVLVLASLLCLGWPSARYSFPRHSQMLT